MNAFVIFAAVANSGDTASLPERFGVSPGLFFSQLGAFFIVAMLLTKFAYKPILAILEERRRKIAESMANAEKIKTELASTEAARAKVLEEAQLRANRLIEEARAVAAQVQEKEGQKAVAQAEQILSRAREAAAADHAKMLAELKGEIGSLVVKTTAQVVGKVLTEEDQKRIIDEANRELASS